MTKIPNVVVRALDTNSAFEFSTMVNAVRAQFLLLSRSLSARAVVQSYVVVVVLGPWRRGTSSLACVFVFGFVLSSWVVGFASLGLSCVFLDGVGAVRCRHPARG